MKRKLAKQPRQLDDGVTSKSAAIMKLDDTFNDELEVSAEPYLDTAELSHDATFNSLGLVEPLCLACSAIGWKEPSEIQREVLPYALKGIPNFGIFSSESILNRPRHYRFSRNWVWKDG